MNIANQLQTELYPESKIGLPKPFSGEFGKTEEKVLKSKKDIDLDIINPEFRNCKRNLKNSKIAVGLSSSSLAITAVIAAAATVFAFFVVTNPIVLTVAAVAGVLAIGSAIATYYSVKNKQKYQLLVDDYRKPRTNEELLQFVKNKPKISEGINEDFITLIKQYKQNQEKKIGLIQQNYANKISYFQLSKDNEFKIVTSEQQLLEKNIEESIKKSDLEETANKLTNEFKKIQAQFNLDEMRLRKSAEHIKTDLERMKAKNEKSEKKYLAIQETLLKRFPQIGIRFSDHLTALKTAQCNIEDSIKNANYSYCATQIKDLASGSYNFRKELHDAESLLSFSDFSCLFDMNDLEGKKSHEKYSAELKNAVDHFGTENFSQLITDFKNNFKNQYEFSQLINGLKDSKRLSENANLFDLKKLKKDLKDIFTNSSALKEIENPKFEKKDFDNLIFELSLSQREAAIKDAMGAINLEELEEFDIAYKDLEDYMPNLESVNANEGDENQKIQNPEGVLIEEVSDSESMCDDTIESDSETESEFLDTEDS